MDPYNGFVMHPNSSLGIKCLFRDNKSFFSDNKSSPNALKAHSESIKAIDVSGRLHTSNLRVHNDHSQGAICQSRS